jgi:hypothetical protein
MVLAFFQKSMWGKTLWFDNLLVFGYYKIFVVSECCLKWKEMELTV